MIRHYVGTCSEYCTLNSDHCQTRLTCLPWSAWWRTPRGPRWAPPASSWAAPAPRPGPPPPAAAAGDCASSVAMWGSVSLKIVPGVAVHIWKAPVGTGPGRFGDIIYYSTGWATTALVRLLSHCSQFVWKMTVVMYLSYCQRTITIQDNRGHCQNPHWPVVSSHLCRCWCHCRGPGALTALSRQIPLLVSREHWPAPADRGPGPHQAGIHILPSFHR